MRGLRMLLIGALLGWVAALGYVNAQGDGASGELTGADLAEIQQLASQYSQGSDLGNADMWVNVFAEDGIFRIADYGEWIGREEIARYRRETFAPRPDGYTYRHWNSSWVITPDGNGGATGKVYWMGFDPSAEPIVVTDTGIYHDTYVKTDDGWRIQVRHARPDPASADGGSSRPVNLQR